MNPILQFQQQQTASNLGNTYRSLVTSSNPIQMFVSMAQGNPQLQPVVQALQNGGNPQQLFYQLCQSKGVDPQTILNGLKGI